MLSLTVIIVRKKWSSDTALLPFLHMYVCQLTSQSETFSYGVYCTQGWCFCRFEDDSRSWWSNGTWRACPTTFQQWASQVTLLPCFVCAYSLQDVMCIGQEFIIGTVKNLASQSIFAKLLQCPEHLPRTWTDQTLGTKCVDNSDLHLLVSSRLVVGCIHLVSGHSS